VPERTDALGDEIDRVPRLGVLLHEHLVKRLEHRTFDVPVEVVRLEIDDVRVGEQARQALGDRGAVFSRDSSVHGQELRRAPLALANGI
jgi:hypothetical protein